MPQWCLSSEVFFWILLSLSVIILYSSDFQMFVDGYLPFVCYYTLIFVYVAANSMSIKIDFIFINV